MGNRQTQGYIMASVGFVLILVNALSHIFGWEWSNPAASIIGLLFVAIGMKLVRKNPDGRKNVLLIVLSTIAAVILLVAVVDLSLKLIASDSDQVKVIRMFTESDARTIAEKTCIKGGESLAPGYFNENSKTWWFDANLNATKEGCNPACVVSEETRTAEINWRCTGLIPPSGR